MKARVTFKYVRLTRSRYGCVPSIYEVTRTVDEDALDEVIHHYRAQFHVVEVRIEKLGPDQS